MIRRPPRSPLFPSPTLFRPLEGGGDPAHELPGAVQQQSTPRPQIGFTVEGLEQPRLGLRPDARHAAQPPGGGGLSDRKSTRLNSSHSQISYAVFCLKKKNYY